MEYGRQSPTVSVVSPYTLTKGDEAVAIYNKTERTAQEWQEALTYDLMAVDEEGLWLHQKFGYSVPRRNGKSEVVLLRCVWGLSNGEKILYTAHRTTTSHAMWERLERMCKTAELKITSSFRAFGKEHIYTANGGVIEFRTRTSSGGLGEGYDLLIIDEAQEYTPDQETALKYVVSDSVNPQTIMLGTPPTAISAGTVFPSYRKKVLSGEGFESGWAEWSVDQMTDPEDVEAWYKVNPSLGHILKERTIRAEIGEDDIDFNIQRLGLWITYNQKSAISKREWEALAVPKLPKLKGPLFVGIKFGHDGMNVALSIAVRTEEGKIFIEAVDCQSVRNGLEWILDFLEKAAWKKVVIDGANGQAVLQDLIKGKKLKAPLLPKVAEVIKANSTFEQAIATGNIQHANQPALTQAVTNSEKRPIGNSGGFGYRSQKPDIEVALLDSAILAYWACSEYKENKKQSISY